MSSSFIGRDDEDAGTTTLVLGELGSGVVVMPLFTYN